MSIQRFERLCASFGHNLKNVSRLWLIADRQRDADAFFGCLLAVCGSHFDDDRDVNSLRFTY